MASMRKGARKRAGLHQPSRFLLAGDDACVRGAWAKAGMAPRRRSRGALGMLPTHLFPFCVRTSVVAVLRWLVILSLGAPFIFAAADGDGAMWLAANDAQVT